MGRATTEPTEATGRDQSGPWLPRLLRRLRLTPACWAPSQPWVSVCLLDGDSKNVGVLQRQRGASPGGGAVARRHALVHCRKPAEKTAPHPGGTPELGEVRHRERQKGN